MTTTHRTLRTPSLLTANTTPIMGVTTSPYPARASTTAFQVKTSLLRTIQLTSASYRRSVWTDQITNTQEWCMTSTINFQNLEYRIITLQAYGGQDKDMRMLHPLFTTNHRKARLKLHVKAFVVSSLTHEPKTFLHRQATTRLKLISHPTLSRPLVFRTTMRDIWLEETIAREGTTTEAIRAAVDVSALKFPSSGPWKSCQTSIPTSNATKYSRCPRESKRCWELTTDSSQMLCHICLIFFRRLPLQSSPSRVGAS